MSGRLLTPTRVEALDSLIVAPNFAMRARYAIALAIVAAATGGGYFWSQLPDARNLSLVFFGAILLTGAWLGTQPALFAAVLAFFSYNFFLIEPRFSLHLGPADFLAFVAFLVGALLVGGLAGRLSDRARDATNRLRDLTVLFEASRDLSSALGPKEAAERLIRHIEHGGCAAAVWLAETDGLQLVGVSAGFTAAASRASAHIAALLRGDRVDSEDDAVFARLEMGERKLGGVAIWSASGAPATRPGERWIAAMLELGAVAIDRARLASEVTEASIVAEKEGLRTALLSSLSHDLRTPIATILASASALQEHEERFDVDTRREMLETIQEESDRLNRYVANLLEMTRLESGALEVKSVLMDPGEAMASALERVSGRLRGRQVLRVFGSGGRRILVDPVLIEQAVVNILENAIAHTPPGASILVATKTEDTCVLMTVEDEGPGIPAGDLERVFDKFFRGRSDRRGGAGVGLGLSVARGLVQAFGGDIRAVSPAAGARGARLEIRLPAHAALETVE
jgi:two-component system sensor histidine kinase KdpD